MHSPECNNRLANLGWYILHAIRTPVNVNVKKW